MDGESISVHCLAFCYCKDATADLYLRQELKYFNGGLKAFSRSSFLTVFENFQEFQRLKPIESARGVALLRA